MSNSAISLILHPGHSKCGSTAIQTQLYAQVGEFQKRGVALPDARFRFPFEPDASNLDWSIPLWFFQDLFEGRTPLTEFERCLDEAIRRAQDANVRRILISSENLCNFRNGACPDVHKILASRFTDVQILYYIRRQDDWIPSAWQQWVHKDGKTLEQYVAHCFEKQTPDYGRVTHDFEAIYGARNLTVVPLHRSCFVGSDLISDFFHRIGLNDFPRVDAPESAANIALNPYLCEIIARISSVYSSRHDGRPKQLLESFSRQSDLLHHRDPNYLNPGLRQRIRDHFEAENRALHQRYFPAADYDLIFGGSVSGSDTDDLAQEIDGLKQVVAIQMDLVLTLLDQVSTLSARSSWRKRLKARLSRLPRVR